MRLEQRWIVEHFLIDRIFKITEETGKEFIAWLGGGAAPLEQKEAPISGPQMKHIVDTAQAAGVNLDGLKKFIKDEFNLETMKDMKHWQYDSAMASFGEIREAHQ